MRSDAGTEEATNFDTTSKILMGSNYTKKFTLNIAESTLSTARNPDTLSSSNRSFLPS
jgi:hypothetical protein